MGLGLGKMNKAGAELLSSCALNELVIMNTKFEKKRINKQTWQHLRSKMWHSIDYVIVSEAARVVQ